MPKQVRKSRKIVNKKPVGLGDVIEKVTKVTGVKKIVKELFGDDCGCDKRKDKLNLQFEIGSHQAQRCLTEEHYQSYGTYIKERLENTFQVKEVSMLVDLYAHVFAIQYDKRTFCINCSGSARRLKTMQDKLDLIYTSYEKN